MALEVALRGFLPPGESSGTTFGSALEQPSKIVGLQKSFGRGSAEEEFLRYNF